MNNRISNDFLIWHSVLFPSEQLIIAFFRQVSMALMFRDEKLERLFMSKS